MKVKLLDYQKKPVEADIGDLEAIARINMEVITGDEVLTVVYKDYTTRRFDSSNDRIRDYPDGGYPVYVPAAGLNLLEDKDWLKRKSSYDY